MGPGRRCLGGRLTLEDHPYAAGSPVSVVAGDLDFDGSDEIVGHRAPGGALTNDLLEPGNYTPTRQVDEFLLLFEFGPQRIEETGGAQESRYASQASEKARTEFTHIEENITVSTGATAGGVSVDASTTFGMGWENSHTMSWSNSISFAGGYSWPGGGGYPSYWVVPYVYQSTAKTLAGATYPY